MSKYIIGDVLYSYTTGMYPKIIEVSLLRSTTPHPSRNHFGDSLCFENNIYCYESSIDDINRTRVVYTTKEIATKAMIIQVERLKLHHQNKINKLQTKIDKINKHINKFI